jgi:hypothetical protein
MSPIELMAFVPLEVEELAVMAAAGPPAWMDRCMICRRIFSSSWNVASSSALQQ